VAVAAEGRKDADVREDRPIEIRSLEPLAGVGQPGADAGGAAQGEAHLNARTSGPGVNRGRRQAFHQRHTQSRARLSRRMLEPHSGVGDADDEITVHERGLDLDLAAAVGIRVADDVGARLGDAEGDVEDHGPRLRGVRAHEVGNRAPRLRDAARPRRESLLNPRHCSL